MGGGEIARYLGRYGSARVRRAVIISGIPPYLLKTPETPNGAPQEVFDQIAAALTADRAAYFTEWNKNFFNLDETLGKLISAEAVQDAWNLAVSASPEGTIACVATWHTDFRADLPKIDIPVLVLQAWLPRTLSSRTASCPSKPAAPAPPNSSQAASSSRSRAPATACAGPTPTKSTQNCSGSSGKENTARPVA